MRFPILGVGGVLGGWDLYQSKVHPRLRTTSQYKVLLYAPPFCGNFKGEFGIPNSGGLEELGDSYGSGVPPIESPPSTSRCISIKNFSLSSAIWISLRSWKRCQHGQSTRFFEQNSPQTGEAVQNGTPFNVTHSTILYPNLPPFYGVNKHKCLMT